MNTSLPWNRLAETLDRGFGWLLSFAVLGTVLALPRHLDDPYKIGAETFAVGMSWVLATLGLTIQALRGESLGGRFVREPAWIALALFALWTALSVLWTPFPALHARFALAVVAYLLGGHAVLGWLTRNPAPRRLWVVATLGVLIGVECFLGFLHWLKVPIASLAGFVTPGSLLDGQLLALGAPSRTGIPMGSLGNQNYLAELLGLTVPVVLGFGLAATSPRRRNFGIAMAGVGFAIIIACYTRAVVLGLVFGAVAAVLATGTGGQLKALLAPPRDGRGWLTRGVIVSFVAVALIIFGGPLMSKFGRLADSGDKNTASRTGNWQVGLTLLASHPVTGVGLGGWKVSSVEAMHQAHPEGLSEALATARFHQLHNEPLQAFVELGTVGGLLAGLGGMFWVRRVRSHLGLPRTAQFGLIWGLATLLISSVFAFPFHVALTALAVVVVLALGLAPEPEPAIAAPLEVPAVDGAGFEPVSPAPQPAGSPALEVPAWAPAWALIVLVVLGGLSGLAYQRGMWPAYIGSHLQHLAEHTERRVPNGPTHGILYAAALRVDPFKPTHLFATMNGLIKKGQFAEAVQVFEAHRTDGPGSDSYLLYARALEQVKRLDDAKAAYTRVCLSYPPSMRNHQLAARQLVALGGTNPRQAEFDRWSKETAGQGR